MFTIQITSQMMSRLDLLAAKQTAQQKAEARGREFEVEPGNAQDTYEWGVQDGEIYLAQELVGCMKVIESPETSLKPAQEG